MMACKRKRFFTLLEVLVALMLITIASTAVSYRMRGAIEKKKFHSTLERLKNRIFVVHKLATASQADLKGVLKKDEDGWTFLIQSDEPHMRRFSPLHLDPMDFFFNGKKITDELVFDFFASGQASPEGIFSFKQNFLQEQWQSSDLFQRSEGKKSGPIHPKD